MVIVVMGPAGSGKSTIGIALARTLDWRFLDADSLHSAANVERIRSGAGLTDEERKPWLESVAREIVIALKQEESLVIACSALKRTYRDALRPAHALPGAVWFVYLKVSPSELARRLELRVDHFAPPTLLPSQLDTLEEPMNHESDAIAVNGEQPVDSVVDDVLRVTFRNTR